MSFYRNPRPPFSHVNRRICSRAANNLMKWRMKTSSSHTPGSLSLSSATRFRGDVTPIRVHRVIKINYFQMVYKKWLVGFVTRRRIPSLLRRPVSEWMNEWIVCEIGGKIFRKHSSPGKSGGAESQLYWQQSSNREAQRERAASASRHSPLGWWQLKIS